LTFLFTFTILSFIGFLIVIFSIYSVVYHFEKLFAEPESSSSNLEEELLDIKEGLQLNPDLIDEPGSSSNSEEQSLNIPADLQLNLGGLIDMIRELIDTIRQFFESRAIGPLRESGCIASALTGGTSDITIDGNLVIGTSCDDVIDGGRNNEIIYSLGGIDQVYAKDGNDIIYGGSGDDRLYGGKGDDIVTSGIGSNLLDGGSGNDILIAGPGNNLLVGGDGNDMLTGGAGTTIMYGGAGMNTFDCGIGTGIVLDYNPENGDTVAGQCKIINNIGVDFPSDTKIKPPK
jgi:Ca2+-binding RTX toxin-like protein